MRNTIENNLRLWDREYDWPRDGDEWDGQARVSDQPYEAWKRSLVEEFIAPNLSPDRVVLEIGPGHGRWSAAMVGRCRELLLVDLSPRCIEFCRERFRAHDGVTYLTTDGRSLPGVQNGSVDFAWSYDAFVHMDRDVVDAYLGELARVLRAGGTAAIHHAGRRHATLWLGFLRGWGRTGTNLYRAISMGKLSDDDGWRSNLSRKMFRRLARCHGLSVVAQCRSWGERGQFGIPRYGDFISLLAKPEPSIPGG